MSVQSSVEEVPSAAPVELAVLLRGSSMRFLEAGLALVAIVTAVLLGQLH